MDEWKLYSQFKIAYANIERDKDQSLFEPRWIAFQVWLEGVKYGRQIKQEEIDNESKI